MIFVTDLKSRAELNGEIGLIKEKLSNGRLKVFLTQRQLFISISHENILFCNDTNDLLISEKESSSQTINNNLNEIKSREYSRISPFSISEVGLSINPNLRIFQTMPYFYPFGNTPAKLLTQYIPLHISSL